MVPVLTTKYKDDQFDILAGKQLRKLRKLSGLTITDFSEHLNLSPKIISNYENGHNRLSTASIIALYESGILYNYDLAELFQILVIEPYNHMKSKSE